jgi:hypothetical protein
MHKIKCTLLLFDVSQRLLNSIIHPSFGNFVVLGIHHNLVVRRPMYVIMVLAPPLVAISIRKRVLDYLNPIWPFGCYLLNSAYFTSGIGILLPESSIALFISGDRSIFFEWRLSPSLILLQKHPLPTILLEYPVRCFLILLI